MKSYIPPQAVQEAGYNGIAMAMDSPHRKCIDVVAEDVAYALAYAQGIAEIYTRDLEAYFLEHARPEEGDTVEWIEWQMHGGDAGKAWAEGGFA